jgi:hypothetical protein
MTSKAHKLTNLSCRADLEYVGLITAGVPAITKELSFGGKYTEQMVGTPFTGPVKLSVTMGGLRNSETPDRVKKLFKKEVIPVLAAAIPEVGQKSSCSMILHFHHGRLIDFNLAP